jgi:hypothetical protein
LKWVGRVIIIQITCPQGKVVLRYFSVLPQFSLLIMAAKFAAQPSIYNAHDHTTHGLLHTAG